MEKAHVYIYGVIDYWQDDYSNEWGYVNLKSVKNQVENQSEAEEIIVHIHSEGGVVTEGFAIHDYLRSLGKKITTQIEGSCFSIATVIALAGDVRTMTSNADFMIHNPWGYAGGEKDDIRKYADQLEDAENKIAEFYASKTQLTTEEALSLMKEETYFTAENALEKGFITEINQVMKAVALLRPNNNSKKSKMSKDTLTKEEAKGMFDDLLGKMKNFLNGNSGKPQNKVVQDVNGTEITFPDVKDEDEPQVGDKATVDGADADGDYVMPSGETYVFTAGELTEKKEEEEPEDNAEGDDDKDQQIQDLTTENSNLKEENGQLKTEVQNLKDEAQDRDTKIEDLKSDMQKIADSLGSDFSWDADNTPPSNQGKGKNNGRDRKFKI